MEGMSRREFIVAAPIGAGLLGGGRTGDQPPAPWPASEPPAVPDRLDLSPARWVWYPSQRTLQNTFVFLRRTIDIERTPQSARGWICADSRYLLTLNGEGVQWGPPPADLRWPDADPVDLTGRLKPGRNVPGATVLQNNTPQEDWVARPDSPQQWSHCAVVPLHSLYMDIAGLRPAQPAFRRFETRPQLGDLRELRLVVRTVLGSLGFVATGDPASRRLRVSVPDGAEGVLLFPPSAHVSLVPLEQRHPTGLLQYRLAPGKVTEFEVTWRGSGPA